jgi:signal transduction histidine kinase
MSKNIVEKYYGTLNVRNTEEGAEFEITLPIPQKAL